MVPVVTETTPTANVNSAVTSKVTTETTMLSKVNTTSRSTASTVTLTQATQSGQAYDATLAENIANKTENDGIAETGEFYYVVIPTEVDSDVVDYVEVASQVDSFVENNVVNEVEQVVEVTVQVPVETTVQEAVGVVTTSTAPAP
jgi:hypothetical protein